MKINGFFFKLQKVPTTAKIFLLQNLAIMIKTGIPLTEGLRTLGEQTKNQKLKLILNDLGEKIKGGKNFGEGLAEYQNDFGELFVNMVKAGEVSGQLEKVLKELYGQTKKDHEIKTKVRNALIYPSIIVVAMIGIGLFVLFFVLPSIMSMLSDLQVQLPLPTRILIGVSNIAQKHGILLAAALSVLLAAAVKIGRTKKGKYFLDAFFLKLPVVSPIIQKINLARMARSLSSLIKTDIDIVNTLDITSRILGNSLYRRALSESIDKIKKGQKLESIFRAYPKLFPPVIIQMIAVGEETGALDEILENLAGFYEEEISETMDTLPTIIEPILMILIAIGVAGVALAVMMPIYSLTQNF